MSYKITAYNDVIDADEYILSSQNATISVDCSATTGGITYGTGIYVRGDAVVLLAEPKDNYYFVGWYQDKDLLCTSRIYEFTAKENIELNAVFQSITVEDLDLFYTIKFDANGGTVDVLTMITESNGMLSVLPNPTRSGYTFNGWYTAFNGGTRITTSTVFDKDTTVYAHWTQDEPSIPAVFTITFNPNGGAVSTTTLDTGEDGKLISLPSATHTGYTFVGWYTSASGGEKIGTNHVFTMDTTVYAHWSSNTSSDTPSNNNPPSGGSSSSGGSGSTTYTVSIPLNVTGGKLTVSPKNAAKGQTVTLTVTSDEGYELNKMIVTDKDGKELSFTDEGSGKYTFIMPTGKVKVEASFSKIQTESESPSTSHPFIDAPARAWYVEAVQYVYEKGIMTGLTDTTFGPDIATNRGMIVTMLYRLEGKSAIGAPSFTDVPAGEWYSNAVAWAQANGIVKGMTATTFEPLSTITRQQIATILYRYAIYKGYDVGSQADLTDYTDMAQIGTYALTAMQWANAEGLITGTTPATLDPTGSATRAQVAMILMRFCENVTK